MALVAVVSCGGSSVSGTAILNMQPPPPTFEGHYDFDLLGPAQAKACFKESTFNTTGAQTVYWLAGVSLEGMTRDPMTIAAIGAAAMAAIEKTAHADTIVITRIIAEGKDESVCASVYGRAVRLKKAGVDEKEQDSPNADNDDIP